MSVFSCCRRCLPMPGGAPSKSDATSEPASLNVVAVSWAARECENATAPLTNAVQTSSDMLDELRATPREDASSRALPK
jgi:hypothetical protein